MSTYPKYLYHQEYEAVIVHNAAEEKELGPGWEDSPAKFGIETHPQVIVEEKPKLVKKSESSAKAKA